VFDGECKALKLLITIAKFISLQRGWIMLFFFKKKRGGRKEDKGRKMKTL
jgi:hypothetical protein